MSKQDEEVFKALQKAALTMVPRGQTGLCTGSSFRAGGREFQLAFLESSELGSGQIFIEGER